MTGAQFEKYKKVIREDVLAYYKSVLSGEETEGKKDLIRRLEVFKKCLSEFKLEDYGRLDKYTYVDPKFNENEKVFKMQKIYYKQVL